ncbi:MAG: LysE family translocator [Chloroflexaceae bacterium]
MEISFLWHGIIIGFAIAAPVGPIGVLCIRRTLTAGRAAGLVSGLGAATADACYGCIAGFGLTLVSNLLLSRQTGLQLLGGLFLLYLGLKTWFSPPAEHAAGAGGRGLLNAYTSTFLLTITNPMTIFAFMAIFAGLGLAQTGGNYSTAALVVVGVFTGSALWWLLLSGSVSIFRARITPTQLLWINRIAGAVIAGFGLWYTLAIFAGIDR